ncbi:MAG: DUF5691 domain-containing protein [Pseudomonadota bacterium]
MKAWDTLLQAALVGTDKPWLLPPDDDASEPVNTMLQQAFALAAPEAPGQLLRLAGALAVCRRAGWVAPVATAALPAPALAETRQLASEAWGNLLSAVLSQGPLRLQIQVLQAMNAASLHAPPLLLPDLLHLGRSSVAARASLLPALGERGRWLAAHNPEWSFACGAEEKADSDTHWQHGSLDQRRAVLLAERAADPAKARERLAAEWANLPGKDRAVLIQTLATGLQAEDEDFLNTQLLKDRAQDVRRAAADLLAALPGSAYSQRMSARLLPLVGVSQAATPGLMGRLLGRAASNSVTVDAPAQAEADWKNDQLEAERPKFESLGERAWWLYQLSCRSSLSWWTTHTGLDPAALVKLATGGDWAEALLRGWTHAVQQQPDVAWAEALLLPNAGARWGSSAALLALLPLERREQYQLARLEKSAKNLPEVIAACLAACPPHANWGLALSSQIVQMLKTHISSAGLRYDYSLRQQLPDVACALHPDALGLWFEIQRDGDESSTLSDDLNLTAHVLHSRKVLADLSKAASTP